MSDDATNMTPQASADSPPPEATGQSDLQEILGSRPPRRRSRMSLTAALVGVLLLGAAFFGGVLTGKHAQASSSNASNNFPGFPGGVRPSGGLGQGGGFNPGSGFATGTVSRVDGDTVYITTTDGRTIKVTTNGSTTVRVTKDGSLSDLSPGSNVVVQGDSSDNGSSIAANTISEGGFGRFDGPGGAPPSSAP